MASSLKAAQDPQRTEFKLASVADGANNLGRNNFNVVEGHAAQRLNPPDKERRCPTARAIQFDASERQLVSGSLARAVFGCALRQRPGWHYYDRRDRHDPVILILLRGIVWIHFRRSDWAKCSHADARAISQSA